MPHHIISIRNKSLHPQRYGLFPSPLSLETDSNGLPPHTCLYKASKTIASPNGSAVFKIPADMMAVCGVAEEGLVAGARLGTSDWAAVQGGAVGQGGERLSMRFQRGHAPAFDRAATTKTVERVGRWAVKVETGFELGGADPPFVGYGLPDSGQVDDIVPLVVWEAHPGAVYVAKAEHRWVVFCLADEGVEDHEILAVNGENMARGAHIDFRGQTASKVEVVHQAGDGFTVVFD